MVTALATTTAVCGAVVLAFVGYLLSIGWRRRRMFRRPAVFRCNLRRLGNCDVLPAPPWSRRPMHAEWVHDVLVVHGRTGAGGIPEALPVRFPEGVVQPARRAIWGRADAVGLRLRLDDGSIVELAALPADRGRLAGPYLAVAALDADARKADQRRPLS
jgi:hypothetical protein